MNNQERKIAINNLRSKISELQHELSELKNNCNHEIIHSNPNNLEWSSAICDICGIALDWNCCKYCGEPEERK